MLKVFLVEDEVVVREGIKHNIHWQEYGFDFCGEASDGELAYPMIQNLKPDIVITDIRMPFMDGLELSRIIKREFPQIKIIILSGYGEFEYAQEAINIGVTEYLLKPINQAQLVRCLTNVSNLIKKEQEEKENLIKYKRDMEEYTRAEKRRLFHDLVHGIGSLSSLLERGKQLNLELGAYVYNILLFTLDMPRQTTQKPQELEDTKEELDELLDQKDHIIKFNFYIEGIAVLFKAATEVELQLIQVKYINLIKERMARHQEISYFGGLGVAVRRLGELPLSYREANKALAYRYFWDCNEIIDSQSISQDSVCAVNLCVSSEYTDQHNIKRVEDFIKTGEKEEIPYFVEEYIKSMGIHNINSLLFRSAFLRDMYDIVIGYLDDLGKDGDMIDKPFQNKQQANRLVLSTDLIQSYIEKILLQTIEVREEIMSSRDNDVIIKAKEFIQENYYKEDLSLNMVSSSVYISPSHFSAIFSHKTGETFIKYLTDLRMNKAKELLRNTNMRTSEIAYMVGYKDPHYFSYLFKKTQNFTPKQYRSMDKSKEAPC